MIDAGLLDGATLLLDAAKRPREHALHRPKMALAGGAYQIRQRSGDRQVSPWSAGQPDQVGEGVGEPAGKFAPRRRGDDAGMKPRQQNARGALAAGVADEALEVALVQVRRLQLPIESPGQPRFQAANAEVSIRVVVLGEAGIGHPDGQAIRPAHREVTAPQLAHGAPRLALVDLTTSLVFP